MGGWGKHQKKKLCGASRIVVSRQLLGFVFLVIIMAEGN